MDRLKLKGNLEIFVKKNKYSRPEGKYLAKARFFRMSSGGKWEVWIWKKRNCTAEDAIRDYEFMALM